MIKRLTLLASIFTAVLLTVSPSQASVSCQPIYGGGQTCITTGEIQIDKKVKHPQTGAFVDNLSINESRFHAQDTIIFRLSVTNTGDNTLSSVEVKDTLPPHVTFVSGPGEFDNNTKTVTYTLKDLKINETRTEDIVVKVVDEKALSSKGGVVCTVNQSSAISEGKVTQDNSQFCIEKVIKVTKGGLPVKPAPPLKETPPTGPEMLSLIGLIPAGLAGILLRKKKFIK